MRQKVKDKIEDKHNLFFSEDDFVAERNSRKISNEWAEQAEKLKEELDKIANIGVQLINGEIVEYDPIEVSQKALLSYEAFLDEK